MEFHVLLVEDDQVTLKTVEQLLRKCDYKVTCAANGREAIQVLTACRQSGVKVDLILTDILMPEVTGFDLINEVVHGDTFCDVPVVIMSSQDSQESVLQAFQAGAADYLIKPIRKNELATLWQHVWRANKAKGSGSGATAIANGQPLAGCEDLDGARPAAIPGVKACAATHGHLKGSSGSSSGAITSVLQSTGGTMLPTRAATERKSSATPLPGASELSGSLRAVETQDSKCQMLERAPGQLGMAVAAAAAPATAAQGSNAGGPLLCIGSGGGSSAPLPCAPLGPRPFAPFSTSVAVHFDLNLAPSSARRPSYNSAANAVLGNGMAAAATASHCRGGTAATVISWSHVDPRESDRAAVDVDADVTAAAVAVAIGEVDDNCVEGDGCGDVTGEYENPPRKRQRLLTGRAHISHNHLHYHSHTGLASTTAATAVQLKVAAPQRAESEVLTAGAAAQSAGGAPAAAGGGGGGGCSCRMAAAEGSQGSRAASASAGPDGCARDATPSGDTFAESPSAYTANATTTTITTTTTGSGSEADEQHQQEQRQGASTERVVRGPSPAVEAGTRTATAVGMYGSGVHSKVAAEPGTTKAAGASARDRRVLGAESYAAVDAPAAAMPANAQREVDGTGGEAAATVQVAARSQTSVPVQHQRSLPHPAAAAPPVATSPGGAVTLPPALQELAALGAARHQELWTQRALAHQQHMQLKQQLKLEEATHSGPVTCTFSAAASGHQHQRQLTTRCPSDAIAGAVGAEDGMKSGSVGRSGSGASTSASVTAELLGVGCSTVTAATSPVGPQDAAEAADGSSAAAAAAGQPRLAKALADGDSGDCGSLHPGKADIISIRPSPAAAAAAAANGGCAGPSQSSDSLMLLRHSDRSAFTAFTVFLPGRVAAAPARPPPPALQAQPPAPMFGHSAPAAAAAAAAAAGGGGGASVLYVQHQFAQRTHPMGSLPPPPTIPILPAVMPLHVPQTPHVRVPPHPKPPDVGAAAAAHGNLGSAAAAAAATVAAATQMPYPDMQQLPCALAAMGFSPPLQGHALAGLPAPHLAAAAAAAAVGSAPPAAVRIPEAVLQLIAHLSGRAAAELPMPEAVAAAPIVVQKASSAARLAALAKYLEKRKHRNFQKKVRYESRKRLAEARPRIRGQFVKASSVSGAGTGPAASAAEAAVEALRRQSAHAAHCVLGASSGLVASGGKAAGASPALTPTPSVGAEPAESLPDQDADMEDDGVEQEEDSGESAAKP
ncbi:hypothetical protein VaNZ11_012097 [Volvox africanus]|uniref:Uncharacterized protein n=1 Tax=Volvox africanus TaxID=51714 RepID=A0ABQ5SD16_9CHLO|nr:hypothetical protein VaNZ11_012097 [Volvox africanus]